MTLDAPRAPDESLFDVLAARARATSDGRLVSAVIGGLLATLGIALWRPPAWLILCALCTCAATFGAWGIAERELAERSNAAPRRLTMTLRSLQLVCVGVGACAVAVACFKLLGVVLGTWIS